jgi:p-hydroxybenzoate 3-monooxygenase
MTRTQVAIIGAGPAGMFLAHLLARQGIDAVVLERRDRATVEGRVRAGVLEQRTVETMAMLGVDARLRAEGLRHTGARIIFAGGDFRIDLSAAKGQAITVYGQQAVMGDLFEAAAARGLTVHFGAQDVALHDIATEHPFATWRGGDGAAHRLDCDFIAGCDGFHGVSRHAIPADLLSVFERVYPFGWLGVLADVPPVQHELVYASHDHGFALASMRSASRSRYYIQCPLDTRLEDWPDGRFWDALCLRLGPDIGRQVTRGAAFEKSIAPLRSFVSEPMRYGNLFLAGDAAHIVPPTGAKGLNLAVSDALFLAEAMGDFYAGGRRDGLAHYSARALARVWKAERFSWWFTGLTHRFPDQDAFARRMQIAELEYLRTSPAMQAVFAENYVGLPLVSPGP